MNHSINDVFVGAHLLNFKARYQRVLGCNYVYARNVISLDHVCPRFTVYKYCYSKICSFECRAYAKELLGAVKFSPFSPNLKNGSKMHLFEISDFFLFPCIDFDSFCLVKIGHKSTIRFPSSKTQPAVQAFSSPKCFSVLAKAPC